MRYATTDGRASAHQKVVLVVDDEVALLEALRVALEPRGFTVLAASNPFVAVRLATMHEPDVIVLDLDMPGMDGMEAARHLKHIDQTRKIPIIAFTGGPVGSISSLEHCGFDRIIDKAGGLEPLESQIEDLIAGHIERSPAE